LEATDARVRKEGNTWRTEIGVARWRRRKRWRMIYARLAISAADRAERSAERAARFGADHVFVFTGGLHDGEKNLNSLALGAVLKTF
jgi:hypothetical protein